MLNVVFLPGDFILPSPVYSEVYSTATVCYISYGMLCLYHAFSFLTSFLKLITGQFKKK